MSGQQESRRPEGEAAGEGLDARLDKAVPTEAASGFLLAGDGSQPGRVFPLTRNTNLLGRSEQADVRIAHPAVSNEHARIINGPLGFEIEDLGSINGTYVNGEKIVRCKLVRGDRVLLGNVEFTFLVEKTKDATMALMPPGASRRGTTLTNRQVGTQLRVDDEDEAGLSLGEILHKAVSLYGILRPHLPFALAMTLAGGALGVGSAFALPPPNTAVCEARLHAAKKANPVDGESRPQEQDSLQFFVDAERSFALPGLVQATLTKLLGKKADDGLVAQVVPRLRLESVGERLYRATYFEPAFGAGPIPSTKLLDTHVSNYIQTDIERALKSLDNETKFLNEKLASAIADLTATNQELAEFKRQNADDLPETSEQAHSSRYYLDTRKGELAAQIAKMAGELAVDEAQMNSDNPLAQSKFQSSQVYRGSLQELKRRLSEAYARGLADGHPDIIQMKNEMGRLEKVIDQEMSSVTSAADRIADPAYSGLKAKVGVERAQLNASRIELKEVERNLERVNHAVVAMPAVAAKLDDLQRQYDAKKRLHDQLSGQAQKATLQLEVERLAAQSRFEIVTPTFILKPARGRTVATRAGTGLGVALALALLVVLVREGRKFFAQSLALPRRRG